MVKQQHRCFFDPPLYDFLSKFVLLQFIFVIYLLLLRNLFSDSCLSPDINKIGLDLKSLVDSPGFPFARFYHTEGDEMKHENKKTRRDLVMNL
jgi:hypothetical protein